ncbi:death-associated protein 1-like [Liolophura sinensis]|uniref:death-associated protein 1-like n=1 Tax=Liolophura sinensis TaxID=3198878 RepID=UPI0031583A61
MSSTDESSDLKGGHPPAVKVGGMRVVQQKKHVGEGDAKKEPTAGEEEEEFAESAPKTDKHHQSILLSGAVTKGDQDFPEAAVKSFHEKPLPTVDKRPNHPKPQAHFIQQPRKQ